MGNRWVVGKVWRIFRNKTNTLLFSSVEFRTVDEAKRAVEKMHQFEYGGRKLAVKLVSDSDHSIVAYSTHGIFLFVVFVG